MCSHSPAHNYGQNINMVKLLAKIDLETTHPKQYAYYSNGIGMCPKSLDIWSRMERVVSDKFEMAVAWSVLITVIFFNRMRGFMDVYGWLA